MSTSTINLPLYQTLVGLNVPKDEASRAADISDLVRKDEILRLATKTDMDTGFAALRLQIEATSHSQTKWLVGTILTTAGLSVATLMSLLHLFPPH
jgi:hypothetical protein